MLHINDLTYRIEGRPLFEQATLAIDAGQKVGLVGRNGTGKSTLFRLIKGEISPDDGEISLRKGMRMGCVDQEVPGGPTSLMDTVLAADTERTALMAEAETASDPMRIAQIHTRLGDIDAYTAEARAGSILSGLGFDGPDQQRACADFSGGWRMRVALAAMLFAEPDILLLDEPTNYLDIEGALWLENHIRKYRGTIFVISHDRDFLTNAVTHIAHLQSGKMTMYSGNYDQFQRRLAERNRLDMALVAKQEEERRKLQAFVDRFKAKASKAKQAQSRVKRLEKMEPIATMVSDPIAPIDLHGPERLLSPPMVRFDDASLGYGETTVLRNINLTVDPDDRIGLLGRNGEGKTTFAKGLLGLLSAQDGHIRSHKKMRVGYFAQHEVDALNTAHSAYDHVVELMPDATEAERRARLAQFGLGAKNAETPAGDLSGGEKARLLFSLIGFHKPHLLVLDEPTNHLDIDSREELVRSLNSYSGAVLLISHDRALLEATTERLWLVDGGSVIPYPGTLDDYRAEQAERAKPDRKPKTDNGPSKADERKARAEARKAIAPLKKAAAKLEKALENATSKIATLDAALSDPALFDRDPDKAVTLGQDRARTAEQIEALETEWLEALATYEAAEADAGL
ncbi:ribosomal protection-like ABC-F family protein [Algimonas porphyrae]|uniref:Glycosyl transferase family 1 n=1 Tax=Algimonas porphyrae TaxID=1128113 RepID=A0ABQ5V5C6_9PROT|nr:ABC-F family ATP-binding cassette domain-containing protein [Algimonas porphyrae]GLQ22043.1 glycosyl transferase family 1 [Algimonas porphyrae]